MEFNSPGAFAAHLVKLAAMSHEAVHVATERSAAEIQDKAQKMIGHYQQAAGPYPEWSPLADSTEAEKARLGFTLGAPLLRTGQMQKSIGHKVSGHEAVIGSDDKNMVYHELGTSKMPPRPVLGPAALRSKAKLHDIIGLTAFALLAGRGWRKPRQIK